MKLQKVEKLDNNVVSSVKVYTRPFTGDSNFSFTAYIYKYV